MSAAQPDGGGRFLRTFKLPPLYATGKGFIGKLLIDDAEVDQLRIDAVRRCEGVTNDLQRMEAGERPVTFAVLVEALAAPELFRRKLIETVPFDSAAIVERAAKRLESLLGADGFVADPRPEYLSSMLSMGNVREMVAGMAALIEKYRKLLVQLK